MYFPGSGVGGGGGGVSLAVLKKKIFKYISFSNPRPPPAEPFGPYGHQVNKLDRDPLDNASHQIIKP